MGKTAHKNEATTPSQGLRSRCQYLQMILSICSRFESLDWEYLQTVLLICFGIGIFNWQLASIMFLFLILPTSPLRSSGAEVTPTAQSGKYIPEEVITPTEAPEPTAPSSPPSSFLVEVVRFGRKAQAVIVADEERPNLERSDSLQEVQPTLPAKIQPVEETVKEQESEIAEKETIVQIEPDTTEGPSEPELSLEKDKALQIDPETNEALIDGHTSTGAEDNGSLPPVPQTNNIYNLTSESAAPLITRIRATTQKSKATRRAKPSPFKHRCPCLKERHAERIHVRHLKMVKAKGIQDRAYQQAVADCVVEAQGGMIGLEIDERAGEQVQAGQSTVAAIRQPGRVDSAVAADDQMDGVEVQEPVVDGAREVEMTDAPPDDVVDELMIGSDIDGEMEVDSDEESVVNDGEAMDVDVDVSEDSQDTKASHANPVTNAGHSASAIIASLSSSMDIDSQSTAGKVNKERLQDKIRREKEELALRNTSSSKDVASGSSRASAQWSQQSAAPATMSQTGNAAISVLAKTPQSMPSTNSASELKEARLGKQAEARVDPAPVASQPISIPAPIVASSSTTKDKDAGFNKEDGYNSDTTQSTTNTPTSTLPSSTSTTAPSSPVPPQASPASKEIPEMAVKRKLPTNGTKAGNAETQEKKPSPAPRPAEDSHPAESSKKARSRSPPPETDAAPEDEVAPLSSIPDDRGILNHTSDILELAGAMWATSGFAESSDEEDDKK